MAFRHVFCLNRSGMNRNEQSAKIAFRSTSSLNAVSIKTAQKVLSQKEGKERK